MTSHTEPEPAAGAGRAASGARIAGDQYQHLIAWCHALHALQPDSTAASLAVEAIDAAAVDDVVIRRHTPPHTYVQVKYAVDATTAVNTDYLLTPTRQGGTSLLQRFHTSWQTLRSNGREPDMQLVTSRETDPADPLLALRDRRTELLIPALQRAAPRSAARKQANHWAAHLGINRKDLDTMLASLRLATGRSWAAEHERASSLMLANGLRADASAILVGIGRVAEWVATGRRELSTPQLRDDIAGLNLAAGEPHAILVISAIDRDPHPEDATVALDWVEHFDGATAYDRRGTRDPNAWNTVMAPQLEVAADQLRASGASRVLVRGAMRLPTWFAVGAQLRQVAGWEVACAKPNQQWPSAADAGPSPALAEARTPTGEGSDLAIAIGVTADPTADVRRYLETLNAEIGQLVTLGPADGAGDQAIRGPSAAVSWAQTLRNRVRQLVSDAGGPTIHLFLAAPAGLALLLGHRWNRVATTIVYEDLGAGHGYVPTFTIRA